MNEKCKCEICEHKQDCYQVNIINAFALIGGRVGIMPNPNDCNWFKERKLK